MVYLTVNEKPIGGTAVPSTINVVDTEELFECTDDIAFMGVLTNIPNATQTFVLSTLLSLASCKLQLRMIMARETMFR